MRPAAGSPYCRPRSRGDPETSISGKGSLMPASIMRSGPVRNGVTPDDAKRRDHRNREEHADRPRDLAARDDAEDHQRRMDLDAPPHDGGARHVVLDEPPRDDEREQPERVPVA